MPYIKLEQLIDNPFRDMERNPIIQSKVDSLKASVEKTDFWDNLLCRPKGNTYDKLTDEALSEFLKGLTEAPEDMICELAYGHHRLHALIQLGWDIINIPIKVIDDERELHIMAEENKADYGSNMNVLLETVRQVRVTLHAQAREFEDFDDYVERYNFFKAKKDWTSAKKDIVNIGFRRVHQFLGDAWSEQDIRTAAAVLNAIEGELFDQTQITDMPSVNTMKQYVSLAKAIREQEDFPEFFKDLYVDASSDICCDPEKGTTVKILGKAVTMTKKGNVPTDYLLKQKVTEFNLVKQLKLLVTGAPEDEPIEPDSFLEVDGLKDYEGIEEAVESVKESLKKDAERRERAGGADTPDDAEAESEATTDEAQAAIAQAEAEAGEAVDPGLPEIDETVTDITALAATFVESAGIFGNQVDRLRGQVDDLSETVLSSWGVAFEDVYAALTRLGLEAYGKEDLLSMVDKAEVNM